MKFIQKLFSTDGLFKDDSIIGLSSIRKKGEYVKITIPESYKKTYLTNMEHNFLLF